MFFEVEFRFDVSSLLSVVDFTEIKQREE